MTLRIRRLGAGDEPTLARLAADDAAFDLDDRGEPQAELEPAAARAYLANPTVLHWVATEANEAVGFLLCFHLPLRSGDGHELLLYEIGVHHAWRRRGIGRALLAEMERWMAANGVAEVWVLADNPGATEFYRACGFGIEPDQPVYLTRRIRPP